MKRMSKSQLKLILKQLILSYIAKCVSSKSFLKKINFQKTRANRNRKKLAGLNIIGFLKGELGIGEAARGMMRAAIAANIPISLIDFEQTKARQQEDIDHSLFKGFLYNVNLCHINADGVPVLVKHFGKKNFRNHYNIGYWCWELPRFPDSWFDNLKYFDEIWTLSSFCQEAIARKSKIPVICVPPCIDTNKKVNLSISRKDLFLPEDGFIFYNMSDAFSFPERKNPISVIKAYCKAFPRGDGKTYLVLKISNSDQCPDIMKKIYRLISNNPSILLIEKYFTREELTAMLNNIDCFVSLHRSEGFGLGLAESMVLGKPVITTGWSGNMEFTTADNSMLVDYQLTELQDTYGPYEKGQVWAEPDIDDAANKMIKIVQDEELRLRLKNNGLLTIESKLTPLIIGDKIKKRLNIIHSF